MGDITHSMDKHNALQDILAGVAVGAAVGGAAVLGSAAMESSWDMAQPNDRRTHWGQWTSEDWRGLEGTEVIVRDPRTGCHMGRLERCSPAPWDLHIRLHDGKEYYRGGDQKLVGVDVRIAGGGFSSLGNRGGYNDYDNSMSPPANNFLVGGVAGGNGNSGGPGVGGGMGGGNSGGPGVGGRAAPPPRDIRD